MRYYRKRKRKVVLTDKERKTKMLTSSEWILLGVFFVAVSETIVKHYELTWKYLPYTFAVVLVLSTKIMIKALQVISKGANIFLNSLKDM